MKKIFYKTCLVLVLMISVIVGYLCFTPLFPEGYRVAIGCICITFAVSDMLLIWLECSE